MEQIELDHPNFETGLRQVEASEWDAIAVSSWFNPADLLSPAPGGVLLAGSTQRLLNACAKSLTTGGLLFIYGAPHRLPVYAGALDALGADEWTLEFKYWIGIQLHQSQRVGTLHPAHVGLLLFHKVSRKGSTRFGLRSIRIPHEYCSACGQNLRDWGGKKHLMNPQGAALSDVWLDLPMRSLTNNRMPGEVLERIAALVNGSSNGLLHIIEFEPDTKAAISGNHREPGYTINHLEADNEAASPLPLDRVERADCVAFMERLLPNHADSAFDLVFADPPYNLDKLYSNYTDTQAAVEYLRWCDGWLELCARLLKPGGSMFILNLPIWALSHARTVDKALDFRHWIVWQALAEPRGRLLPAHYALLYYTKPGGQPVFNYRDQPAEGFVSPIDSPEYCLRTSCIKRRKAQGNDKTVALTDVWFDVHRIKHKRDRDCHPCQLPEKLLERIILLASNPGQLVFDPFCGVGTTAVVARRLGRHYLTTDIDPNYVRITVEKLEQMEQSRTRFGDYVVSRTSTRRETRPITKKHIESAVQRMARQLGRTPELEDLKDAYSELYEAVFELYQNPRKALGAARVVLKD